MASTFAIQSPEDLLNNTLVRLGFKLRIGSIWEGSEQAKKALDIYVQTRDTLLRDGDWPFAERDVQPTLLKAAPPNGYVPPTVWSSAYPPLPWANEYLWPSDCLKVRSLKPQQPYYPNFDPQPNLFTEANDTASLQRVILSNVSLPCVLVYTGQVTDLTQWPVDTLEALAAAIGRRLSGDFGGQEMEKIEAADEQASYGAAAMTNG